MTTRLQVQEANKEAKSESQAGKQNIAEMERTATQRARDRANTARWDLDIALLLIALLIVIIILLFQEIGIAIVAPIAFFGLSMVWLMGWRRGRQLFQRFYNEELLRLKRELKMAVQEVIEETVKEKVQKEILERFK